MTRSLIVLVLLSTLAPPLAAAPPGGADAAAGQEVLVARYALLVGGRQGVTAPSATGVLSPRELSEYLLDWEPEADNEEVRRVLALNQLYELSRQAAELPLEGGVVSGVYNHDGSTLEVGLKVRPVDAAPGAAPALSISAAIHKDGELLSSPTILAPLGERAIVTSEDGPAAPFLFLVVEIDRVASDELRARGLRNYWRKDHRLVDGVEVVAPVAIQKTVPVYPPEAKNARQQGRVVLRLAIDADGRVEDAEVIEGQPLGLSEAAVAAARTWVFEPALHDGRPVPVLYVVTIAFRLD